MVFYQFPSAQQILQRGHCAAIINGTSNVGSTDINIFELRQATIHQQPDTDSLISFCFVVITGTYVLKSYEPGLDLDVALELVEVDMSRELGIGTYCISELSMHPIFGWSFCLAQSRRMTDGVEAFWFAGLKME